MLYRYAFIFLLGLCTYCSVSERPSFTERLLTPDLKTDVYNDSLFIGKSIEVIQAFGGKLYVADRDRNQIMVLDTQFTFQQQIGYEGEDEQGMKAIIGLFVGYKGILAIDCALLKILNYSPDGKFLWSDRIEEDLSPKTRFFSDGEGLVFIPGTYTSNPVNVYASNPFKKIQGVGKFKEGISRFSQTPLLAQWGVDSFISISTANPTTVQFYSKDGKSLGEVPVLGSQDVFKDRLSHAADQMKQVADSEGIRIDIITDIGVMGEELFMLTISHEATADAPPRCNQLIRLKKEDKGFVAVEKIKLDGCEWATTFCLTPQHIFAFNYTTNAILRYPLSSL